jgi:hypothetical protein
MKLSIHERLLLFEALPREGGLAAVRQLRQLRESLGFTDDERERFRIVSGDGQISWNVKNGDGMREYEFGTTQRELIVGALNALDEKKALTDAHIPLCDKFLAAENA